MQAGARQNLDSSKEPRGTQAEQAHTGGTFQRKEKGSGDQKAAGGSCPCGMLNTDGTKEKKVLTG
jgi:hypothetical protein